MKMKLVIDRKTWGRGGNFDKRSCLYEASSGKKCCLGFYAETLGADLKSMVNEDGTAPLLARRGQPVNWPDWMWGESLGRLVHANDESAVFTEKCREAKITEEFAKHAVEVEFVG
jgi:hypothetical protein